MANVSDQELMKNRMHNASSIGPGAYTLPEILGSGATPSLSSMRASPKISFGIKSQKKQPYYHECYTDFIGKDSPGMNKYRPVDVQVSTRTPSFAQAKFERFHKPQSLVRLQADLPCQYATLDFSDNIERKRAKHAKGDLMGLGKKLTYPARGDTETTPGPLYFKEMDPRTMEANLSKMKSRASPI